MRIAANRHAVPSERISNQSILDKVAEESAPHLTSEQLEGLQSQIVRFLEMAGTKVRYRLAEGETAIDVAAQATEAALREAGLEPQDIEFLIYAGVGRGWIEPAAAHAIRAHLALTNATCFDIVDACAAWLRAMQVAHHLIRAGTYRRGMIVSCECGLQKFGKWGMRSVQDLEHLFATCTIGEAATATILSDEDPDDDFYFSFRSFSEHYPLSMIPLDTIEDFLGGSADPRCVPNKFYSLSRDLMTAAIEKVVQSFRENPVVAGHTYDLMLGHAASERASHAIMRALDLPMERYFSTHPDYGNTVAASVPLALSIAREKGRLSRDDKVLIVLGAAGITVGLSSFTF